jgi:hypothetical protein
MYVDEHPLTLNLDIDRIHGLIGRWRDEAEMAGLLARAVALSAAQTHLAAGHDVIVLYDRLLSLVASRPTAKVVATTGGDVQQAYQDFVNNLS